MTYREKLESTKDWRKRATIINLYHKLKTASEKWTIRKTSKYFRISLGQTCEAIKIAENIDVVRACSNRKEALMRLK